MRLWNVLKAKKGMATEQIIMISALMGILAGVIAKLGNDYTKSRRQAQQAQFLNNFRANLQAINANVPRFMDVMRAAPGTNFQNCFPDEGTNRYRLNQFSCPSNDWGIAGTDPVLAAAMLPGQVIFMTPIYDLMGNLIAGTDTAGGAAYYDQEGMNVTNFCRATPTNNSCLYSVTGFAAHTNGQINNDLTIVVKIITNPAVARSATVIAALGAHYETLPLHTAWSLGQLRCPIGTLKAGSNVVGNAEGYIHSVGIDTQAIRPICNDPLKSGCSGQLMVGYRSDVSTGDVRPECLALPTGCTTRFMKLVTDNSGNLACAPSAGPNLKCTADSDLFVGINPDGSPICGPGPRYGGRCPSSQAIVGFLPDGTPSCVAYSGNSSTGEIGERGRDGVDGKSAGLIAMSCPAGYLGTGIVPTSNYTPAAIPAGDDPLRYVPGFDGAGPAALNALLVCKKLCN